VISWFIRGWCRAVSPSPSLPLSLSGNRGWVRLPLSLSPPLLVCLFLLSCAQPTDSTDEGSVERERVEVSGSIVEDAVWESGKEYVVTGDVTVEEGVTLTIQPDVVVKFAHERADEYYGITVEGTLIADGKDSTTAIPFTSGAEEWARKPGGWRG